MAGPDSNGLKWAEAYDRAADQILGYGAHLEDALLSVARKLTALGRQVIVMGEIK